MSAVQYDITHNYPAPSGSGQGMCQAWDNALDDFLGALDQ